MLRVLKHESVRRSGIEPDVEDVIDFLPPVVCELAEETLARAGFVPGVGAFLFEGLDDADVYVGNVQNLDRTVRLVLDEEYDGRTPGALARDHPVGAALDHSGDAVLALRWYPAGRLDCGQRAVAQRVGMPGDVHSPGLVRGVSDPPIHRNEPLRRVAKDHRLLRAP